MRGFGEITHLCDVASPTIGVVTRVGQAHTARLGGIEGVARAKAELVASLPTSGTAVLNADDERVLAMSAIASGTVVTYGQHGDVTPTEAEFDAFGRARFRFDSPWGSAQVALQVSGAHMMSNALAAIAVGGVLKLSLEEIVGGLEAVEPEDHRMVVHEMASGSLLIDDCYNANPTSVVAALRTLADLDVSRRIAVLGEMAEVDEPVAAHRSVADAASQLGIEVVPIMTDLYDGERSDVLPASVTEMLATGDTAVLVKGSRVAGLERIVEEVLHDQ
jgi:UDP-N-acetylmuramoyl-tripeptide--D-alanyl-D-alanine ligase